MATKAKPKKPIPRVAYQCDECGEILNRKGTEPAPISCSCCHSDHPHFTALSVTLAASVK